MKKLSLLLIPVLAAVTAIPAFCAMNMNKGKLEDSIKNCSYFRTSSFIEQRGEQYKVKFNEKIEGYVNGKCRYVTELHYQDGRATGKICDLDANQLYLLQQSKANPKRSNSFETVKCESYNLINNQWVKDPRGTTLAIPR